MFEKYKAEINLVKKDAQGSYVIPTAETQADVLAIGGDIAKDVMTEAAKLALVLMAADTVRKVALSWLVRR